MTSAQFLAYAASCGCDDTSIQGAAFRMALWFQMDGAMSEPDLEQARRALATLDDEEKIDTILTARAAMLLIMERCGESLQPLTWVGYQRLDSMTFGVPESDLRWGLVKARAGDGEAKRIAKRLIGRAS